MCLSCRQHEEGASWPSLHPKPPSRMENKEAHASMHFTASHHALQLWLMGLLIPLRTSLKAERQAHVHTLSPSTLSRRRIEAVLNEPLDKIASAPLRQPRGLFSLWELHENLKDKVNPYCRCRELFSPSGTLRTSLLVILHRTNSINLDCFLKSVSWKIDFPL